MKLFKTAMNNSVYYSIFYSAAVLFLAMIPAISAMSISNGEIDLRFIGPLAIFFMVMSVMFTLLPFNLLRTWAYKQLSHVNRDFVKGLPKFFLISESLLALFLLFSYMGVMSGSIWGAVGLFLLSVLNLIGLAVSTIVFIIFYTVNRSSDNIVKYKVEFLNEKAKKMYIE